MKYYLYISSSKVDMLLPQIPGAFKQKISAELKFDLAVLSGGIKTEREALDNRISRLQTVARYIQDSESVGSVEKPEDWIYGENYGRVGYFREDGHMVAFAGSTGESSFLLAGSVGHLVGIDKPEPLDLGYSFLPRILKHLEYAIYISDQEGASKELVNRSLAIGGTEDWYWQDVISNAHKKIESPIQKLEFLARVLWKLPRRQIVLGTPLYVALLAGDTT